MSSIVCTCNMAEALYLLHCGSRVVKVRTECTWPYGLEECAIVFEGQTVEADHDHYIKTRVPVDLCELPELFAAVTAALPVKGNAS
jgi:hypothetical protein